MARRVAACEPVLGGFAHQFGAVGIGEDEAGIGREDVERHGGVGGEEQPVAGDAIVGPFLVDAEILDRRLDLDDPDFAAAPKPDHVRPPAGGQRQLGHHREALGAQQPSDTALHGRGMGRLASVDRGRQAGKAGKHGAEVATLFTLREGRKKGSRQ